MQEPFHFSTNMDGATVLAKSLDFIEYILPITHSKIKDLKLDEDPAQLKEKIAYLQEDLLTLKKLRYNITDYLRRNNTYESGSAFDLLKTFFSFELYSKLTCLLGFTEMLQDASRNDQEKFLVNLTQNTDRTIEMMAYCRVLSFSKAASSHTKDVADTQKAIRAYTIGISYITRDLQRELHRLQEASDNTTQIISIGYLPKISSRLQACQEPINTYFQSQGLEVKSNPPFLLAWIRFELHLPLSHLISTIEEVKNSMTNVPENHAELISRTLIERILRVIERIHNNDFPDRAEF